MADNTRKLFPILIIAIVLLAAVMAGYALISMARLRGRPVPSQYQYPIEAVEIDPKMLLYEACGQFATAAMSETRGIAVDANAIVYVVGDRAIAWYGTSGDLLGKVDLPFEPLALALSEGLFYVTARDHVEVFDRSGQRLQAWPSVDSDSVLTSIAIYQKEVFVADAGNRVIYRYDHQGQLLTSIGKKDPDRGVEGLVVPSPHLDMLVDEDGLLMVANPGRHRIEAYTFDGQIRRAWGRFGMDLEGFSGCCNPISIAQLPDGDILTCEKGIIRVKVFDRQGRFLGAVAGPCQLGKAGCTICQTTTECQTGAFDIAADTEGKVYVLDTIDGLVRIFKRKEGTVRP